MRQLFTFSRRLLPLMAGLVLAFSPAVAQAGFAGPSAITIDGTFTDWVVDGVNVYPRTDVYTPNGALNKAPDITRIWSAMSAANGTSPVSSGNLLQNVYFRFDTATTSFSAKQAYWVQLNLGAANPGYADHALQFWVDYSANPSVTIVLYEYTGSYPAMGAFTSSAITARVANRSGYGTSDANAAGSWAQNGTTYSFEAKIPIGWYSSTYGGAVKDDGTGAGLVASAVFSSTGSSGSKGTISDQLDDGSQNPYFSLGNAVTGDTTFVAGNAGGKAFSVSASVATLTPVAGASDSITLTVRDYLGNTDATFTGTKNVTISGFLAAPNGSYGSFNGVTLNGSPQTISVSFVNGVATVPLIL